MKSAVLKQNNMTIICQEHQSKGKWYIFTLDPKFINLFDFWNEEVTIVTCVIKNFFNKIKIFVEQQ